MTTSFIPTHPGEVLKDELSFRGIKQKEFAERIGVPYTMLNDILNEKRPLSSSTAILVESALGISADILIGLQTDYNMFFARRDKKIRRRAARIQPYPAIPAGQI